MHLIIKFMMTALIIILLETLYSNYIASSMIKRTVNAVQGSPLQIRHYAVTLAYFFAITILFYFIIYPKKSIQDGALLGFLMYATFDATNHALLKGWGILPSILDIIWGTLLFGTTTAIIKQFS